MDPPFPTFGQKRSGCGPPVAARFAPIVRKEARRLGFRALGLGALAEGLDDIDSGVEFSQRCADLHALHHGARLKQHLARDVHALGAGLAGACRRPAA